MGSTKWGAALNLTNSIMGAGCIGYGGAFAASGGLASLLIITSFAILSKLSFDMVIDLSLQLIRREEEKQHRRREQNQNVGLSISKYSTTSSSSPEAEAASFEAIGEAAFGNTGFAAVFVSKSLFAFGCMVAYFVIIKDNAAPALQPWLGSSSSLLSSLLMDPADLTTVLATCLILPLSLQRDISVLENFSKLKIATYGAICVLLVILSGPAQQERHDGTASTSGGNDSVEDAWVDHWLTIKPGLLPNTGTFVFAFVSQHTVHLIFQSLRSEDRNLASFGVVSTAAILASATIMLGVGLPSYVTFWDETSTDLFSLYSTPTLAGYVIAARLLLSVGMILTYPMPLLSLRDSLTQLLPTAVVQRKSAVRSETTALLKDREFSGETCRTVTPWWFIDEVGSSTDESLLHPPKAPQLIWPLHVVSTVFLWGFSLILALSAPSLGVVLNLVGCLSGATMAFVLPGLFAAKIYRGWTPLRVGLVAIGLVVACLGSYYTLLQP